MSSFSGPPPKEERIQRERSKVVAAIERAGAKVASGAEGEETLLYGAPSAVSAM